jgi:hypothetical protein
MLEICESRSRAIRQKGSCLLILALRKLRFTGWVEFLTGLFPFGIPFALRSKVSFGLLMQQLVAAIFPL